MTLRPDSAEAALVRQHLASREAELRGMLRAHTLDAAVEEDLSGADFKELADADTHAAIDEAQAAAALGELQGLQVARNRLADGQYGTCVECGEDIDPRRLESLPAALYCAPCQELLERRTLRAA